VFGNSGQKEREKVIDLIDVDSAGLLANNLFFAIDSAGWFWDVYKTIEYGSKTNKEKYKEILHKNLNEVSDYADKYLSIISKFVNGGGNGMAERQVYYNELKNNVFKFNIKCINRDKIKK
jgi:predicted chitinase